MERRLYRPEIAGEWNLLFKPDQTGCYVNDHTLIQAHDGSWHVFGITAPTTRIQPDHERYFTHGWGDALDKPFSHEGKTIDHGTRAWAPGAIAHKNRYYMYYGPAPTKMAVSPDLNHWINHEVQLIGHPIDSCHRDHMIIKLNAYTWAMYVTGIDEAGFGCISVLVSNDLISWRFVQYALTTSGPAALKPGWGATESPFVVRYQDAYYLFITYTDCSDETYNQTVVFRSQNPYDFGDFNGDLEHPNVIAKLFGHASEVVYDPDSDAWYITTCGWPGKGIPHEGAVSIARLEWRLK